jgi:carbonic anhydrase/acetyltransferase-like protein (isoleucine patch superfamily)
VLGGNVSGSARIEDHATVLNGATVSGGTVGGLSVLMSGFSVTGTAKVEATFLPLGYFEGKSVSGSARLYGDLEYRVAKSSGSFFGMVDDAAMSKAIEDVTVAPPYAWRP